MRVSSAISIEPSTKKAPSSFRVFAMGKNVTTKGTHVLTPRGAAAIAASWAERKTDLHMDYEHRGILRVPVASPAAAWFSLEVRADGLYAVNVRWTPKGKAHLEAGEYRYFSPAYAVDERGEITGLTNVALTNNPATHDLQPLVAASDKTLRLRAQATPKGPQAMSLSIEQKQHMMELFNKFLEMQSAEPAGPADVQTEGVDAVEPEPMAAAADAETIEEAVAPEAVAAEDDAEQAEEEPSEMAALVDAALAATGLPAETSIDELIGALLGLANMKTEGEAVAARLGELEGQVAASARESKVQSAIQSGRLAPHQRAFALGLNDKQLDGFLSTARQLRPVGKLVAASAAREVKPQDDAIDAGIRRLFGLNQ